jgi:hypothetical protein
MILINKNYYTFSFFYFLNILNYIFYYISFKKFLIRLKNEEIRFIFKKVNLFIINKINFTKLK